MSTASEDIATKDPDGELRRDCGRCGRTATADGLGETLTWTREASAQGTVWICTECTRRNLDAIEGGLDDAYWV
ncbi:hypothetical protein AB0I28_31280 [Phytomonospora sp. NPDC050363]|uniref:hypothetical protein n=1 Tax=Phytomonospora sp. NPDC050363 TaxID=3155642 RepID=UPI0033DB0360